MASKVIYGENLSVKEESVGSFFWDRLQRGKDTICQLDVVTGEKETYQEVKNRSVRVAIALRQRGVTSKDVICFCTRNTMDSCIPIFASFFVGAKVANLEPSLSLRNTTHLISLVAPKMIFVEESSLELIEESVRQLHLDTELVVFGKSEKHLTFSELTKPQKDESQFLPAEVDLNDIALMFFSSGTTGLPKAICHSHTSYLAVVMSCLKKLSTSMLHFTTMYWISGMMVLARTLDDRGTRAFFSRPINGQEAFEIIEKYKIESIFMAPSLTHTLTNFKNYQHYDRSSLKYLLTGGTSITTKQIQHLEKIFSHGRVIYGYGMSEVGLISVFHAELVLDEQKTDFVRFKIQSGSCGRIVQGIGLKIRDPNTGITVGVHEKGEICVKSKALMLGYYKADNSSTFDEEGFLKTGDIGYYDEDDFIYIIDRIKEMFKYLSWHIVPSSIEAVLHEHPAVQEAVVFGLPQGEDGDVPAAWVILRENPSKITPEEIEQFVAERVSDKEKLRGGVSIVKSIPKTPTGKIIRSEVRSKSITKAQQFQAIGGDRCTLVS